MKSDTLGNKRPGGHKVRAEVDGHPKERGMGKRRCGKRHAFRRIGQGRKGERREEREGALHQSASVHVLPGAGLRS